MREHLVRDISAAKFSDVLLMKIEYRISIKTCYDDYPRQAVLISNFHPSSKETHLPRNYENTV